MIYLYAITEPVDWKVDTTGLADQPVQCHCAFDLCAVFTDHAGPTVPPIANNIWRHEQVIERLMQTCTLLPARFGTTFKSKDHLAAMLDSNRDALRAGLDRVRGCVELGARAMWRETSIAPPTPIASSGLEYMRARARQERERESRLAKATELSDALHASLSQQAIQATRKSADDSQFVLTAAYLIRQDQKESFRARVQEISNEHAELRILCTGPWPPYHFVPPLRPAEVCHA